MIVEQEKGGFLDDMGVQQVGLQGGVVDHNLGRFSPGSMPGPA